MKHTSIAAALIIACFAHSAHAQGFLDKAKQKAKNKINGVTEQKANSTAGNANAAVTGQSAATVPTTGDDPSPYGSVIIDHLMISGDGMSVPYIVSATDAGGQIQAKYSYGDDYYNFANGAGSKTGQGGASRVTAFITKNSEADYISVDLRQEISLPASMRTAPSVVDNPAPGKYNAKFHGKTFASYLMMMGLMRNADSSVIMTLGTNDGKKYVVKTSNGQSLDIPKYAAMTYMSPDGNYSGVMIQNATAADAMTNTKATFYITGVSPIIMSSYGEKMWLHNSGSVFSIDANDRKTLKQNDKPYHTFEQLLEQDKLFISNDGKRYAWYDGRLLHFSDGKVFEASSIYRILGKDKQTLVFTSWTSSKIYLCHKDL